jgi:phosphatidylserine decarboxylase
MTKLISALSQHEQLNFLLTNRVPRKLLTQFMGWYSGIESPLLTKISIYLWKIFADDLDLSESRHTHFNSLRACFIRELKAGARPIDPHQQIISSPCDGIIGACGKIEGTSVFQAKNFPYDISDLIPDKELQKKYKNGTYVTLRLKSSMYHRFHAPLDCSINKITYISGDTWNVNPIALKRVEKLYCKNERAVVDLHTANSDKSICLVPVAAILVASMKFNCLSENLDLQYRGPNIIKCNADYKKGDELGYFQHGSTIILFATANYRLDERIHSGLQIKMGQALLLDTSL